MGTIVTATRLLLVVVLLLAAIGKLLDRPGSRTALIEFDVPPQLAGFGAVLLPALELATAVALLLQLTTAAAAVVAAVMFAVFTAAIGRVLAQGRAPSCHCFGQLHSAPAGSRTIARNGVLLALAVFVALAAPGRPVDALLGTHVGGTAAGAGSIVLLVACAWLWSANRRLQGSAARPGPAAALPVGAPAPAFTLPTASGELASLSDCLDGRPAMLLFTSALCTQCRLFMPALAVWQARLTGVLSIVPIAHGDQHASLAHALEHGVEGMLFTHDDRAVIDAYSIPVTPCAILVSPELAIASAPIQGADAIDGLLAVIAHDRVSAVSAPSAATA